MGVGGLYSFFMEMTLFPLRLKRTHEKTLVFSHALFCEKKKTIGFVPMVFPVISAHMTASAVGAAAPSSASAAASAAA